MQTLKAFVAFLTLTSFMTGGISLPVTPFAGVEEAEAADTTTPFLGTAVPSYTPASMPQLSLAMSGISQAMSRCDLLANIQDPLGALKNSSSSSASAIKAAADKKKVAAKCPDTNPNGKYTFTCDMKCAAPSEDTDFNKEDFCSADQVTIGPRDHSSTKTNYQYKSGKDTEAKNDKAELTKYLMFLHYENDQCLDLTMKAVNAQVSSYQCKTQALASAVSLASTQLQAALNQNNQNYTKMVQFSNQVQDQMTQVDQILGPDPTDPNAKSGNAQFGGLLGIQKNITDNIAKWNSNKSTFKTRNTAIQQRITQNDQTLKTEVMAQVTDCMKSNADLGGAGGGTSLQCYKPASTTTTDANGKTTSTPVLDSSGNVKYTKQLCGPLEYVRSQVTQAPFRQGLKSASRNEQSQSYGQDYDALINSMLRDAGAYDTASGAGALATRVTDWPSLIKKYSNQMSALSAETGINIAAQLQQASASCNAEGVNYENQQRQSASSRYNLALNGDPSGKSGTPGGINGDKNTLKTDVDTANTEVSQGLTQAVAVLGGSENFSCSESDLTKKIDNCYAKLDQQVGDILNGGPSSKVTTKPITGGSLVASFNVSCRGINQCVTTFQNVRQAKKTQYTSSTKATEDFVTKGNALVQNQLQVFATSLSGIQNQLTSAFNGITGKLASLGITTSSTQKKMEGESLQQSGKEGQAAGPYQNPKSMAAVLSGMVQPGGLLDFSDDGTKQMLADAKEKTDKQEEKISSDLQTYSKAQSKLASILADCSPYGSIDRANAVQSQTNDRSACRKAISRCKTLTVASSGTPPAAPSSTSPVSGAVLSGFLDSMLGYVKKTEVSQSDVDEADKLVDQIDDAGCSEDLGPCPAYITDQLKTSDRPRDNKNGGEDGAAGKAAGG